MLVSVDQVKAGARWADQQEIPFPVLSDSQLAAHEAFKVIMRLDDKKVAMLKTKGIDVEASSGKKHHIIAVPSVFLIDEGKIIFTHADKNYKSRPKTSDVLNKINELASNKDADTKKK